VALSEDERLVSGWLRERGYAEPEHEPDLVSSGKRPDFLASADVSGLTPDILWAEVKSLGPDCTARAIEKSWPILKQLRVPDYVNGHATLHVTPTTREQSVRALVKMFCIQAVKHASQRVHLIFIRQESDMRDWRCVEVQREIPEKVWARGSGSGMIAVPDGTIEDSGALAVWERDGELQTKPAWKVFDWRGSFDCALVAHIDPNDRPLESISSMSSGTSTVRERTLAAVEDANAQLRNGYKFKPAPGVVFVVPPAEHVDDFGIASALYGRLTAEFCPERKAFGETFHGRDGAFRATKNTHVSVVIRLRRNEGIATYFPNPYAREPIDNNSLLLTGLQRTTVRFL
jgi:hypothetical protein